LLQKFFSSIFSHDQCSNYSSLPTEQNLSHAIHLLVSEDNDCHELQNDINNFITCASNWQLQLYVSKCSVVSYGRNIHYNCNYTLSGTSLNRTDIIKDLDVTFDSKLKPNKRVDKVNKAY